MGHFQINAFSSEDDKKQNSIVQIPEDCLKSENQCAVQMKETFLYLDEKIDLKMFLKKGTILVKNSQIDFELLKGEAWVQTPVRINLKTVFGVVEGKGDFWINAQSQKTIVRALKGEFTISVADLNSFVLYDGFETWFSGFDFSGKPVLDFPRPVLPMELIQDLAALNLYPLDQFSSQVLSYKNSMISAAERLSKEYSFIAQRDIAEYNLKKEKKYLRIKKERAETEKFRQLFREKNYFSFE